jgi:glycosyltransferase 2 family protein
VLVEDRTPETGEHLATEMGRKKPLMRGLRSRLAFNVATLIVTVLFSYVALSGIKLSLAWHALRNSNYWWLLVALLAFAVGTAARALRWRSLFARGRRPPIGPVANAMIIGYFYNNILPARAGEAARVVVLTRRSTTAPVEIVGTVVLERLYDVVALLVIFFAAEPWLPNVSWFGAAAVAAGVLAVLIIIAATMLAVFGDRPLRLLMRPLRRLRLFSGERLDKTVEELVHGLSGLRHPRLALEASVWTLAAWLSTAMCAYLVSVSFHLHLPLASGILVAVAIGLGMILPSPPAAVGVFEGAALIALSAYHVGHSTALPYAVVLHLVNFLPYIALGLLTLHFNSRRPRERARAKSSQAAQPIRESNDKRTPSSSPGG